MTPKEKAQYLIAKFNNEHIEDTYVIYQNVDESKRCALIAVDEIINILGMPNIPKYYPIVTDEYWQQVKTEIENL